MFIIKSKLLSICSQSPFSVATVEIEAQGIEHSTNRPQSNMAMEI